MRNAVAPVTGKHYCVANVFNSVYEFYHPTSNTSIMLALYFSAEYLINESVKVCCQESVQGVNIKRDEEKTVFLTRSTYE